MHCLSLHIRLRKCSRYVHGSNMTTLNWVNKTCQHQGFGWKGGITGFVSGELLYFFSAMSTAFAFDFLIYFFKNIRYWSADFFFSCYILSGLFGSITMQPCTFFSSCSTEFTLGFPKHFIPFDTLYLVSIWTTNRSFVMFVEVGLWVWQQFVVYRCA